MHTRELCSIEMYDNTDLYLYKGQRANVQGYNLHVSMFDLRSQIEATLRPEIDLQIIYRL